MFVAKFFDGRYATFTENGLVLKLFTAKDVEEEMDELIFGYLDKTSRWTDEDIYAECDTAFISRPAGIKEEKAAKIVDEVVRQIITKENGIIDIERIFQIGFKQISETGDYTCSFPPLKREENEPVVFKIRDGFFVFAPPENLQISAHGDSGVEISLCKRNTEYRGEREFYSSSTFATVKIDDRKTAEKIAAKIATAIAEREKLIDPTQI